MNKNRTSILLGIVAIVVFVALAAFVRERFLAARVVLTSVPNGATIFINGNPRTTINNDGVVSLALPIGSQEIGVDREGYWPWVKTVSLDAGSTYTFAPFVVPRALNAEGLRSSNPDHASIVAALDNATIPTPTAPTASSDGNAEMWLDGEEIMLRWNGVPAETPAFMCDPGCEPTHTITKITTQIRSLSFFPGRNDVIIIATLDGVFALEADDRGIQNFQRVYKGELPETVVVANDLYIRDQERLVKVIFE